jgi:tetratricopeptide (TPR) repeat protein
MSQLTERIAQFRKMATDDPENELGHFRLGQLLLEDGQFEEAIHSFERTLELSPQFSKVYQLLATCLVKLERPDEAIRVLKDGYTVADERGDKMPRDEMGRMLVQLGEPAPQPSELKAAAGDDRPDTGFRCERPGCPFMPRCRPLAAPPVKDAIGQMIQQRICADCWDYWFKQQSIKVINELRLDLSSEYGQAEYDRYMRDFLGFEDEVAK